MVFETHATTAVWPSTLANSTPIAISSAMRATIARYYQTRAKRTQTRINVVTPATTVQPPTTRSKMILTVTAPEMRATTAPLISTHHSQTSTTTTKATCATSTTD